MSKEMSQSGEKKNKLTTKDLIYAGAFGAIYIVLMLAIVMGLGAIPLLYWLAPMFVGLIGGTVYMLCVMKVKKFGTALILGLLFALVAGSTRWYTFCACLVGPLLAELVIFMGKYESRKMYLASFVLFNLSMCGPYLCFVFDLDASLAMSAQYYGAAYVKAATQIFQGGFYLGTIGFALVGGIGGALLASKLLKKHFEKAAII